jgi:hypothetical protein
MLTEVEADDRGTAADEGRAGLPGEMRDASEMGLPSMGQGSPSVERGGIRADPALAPGQTPRVSQCGLRWRSADRGLRSPQHAAMTVRRARPASA